MGGGGKSKKKKWSKGKVREKALNLVMFDKPTYKKLLADIPKVKLITTSVLAERLKRERRARAQGDEGACGAGSHQACFSSPEAAYLHARDQCLE